MHAGVPRIERLGRAASNQCAERSGPSAQGGIVRGSRQTGPLPGRAGESDARVRAFEERAVPIPLSHLSEDGGAERATYCPTSRWPRGLEHWDAALPIFVKCSKSMPNLAIGIIGKRLYDLTDALIWVGRFAEATERLIARARLPWVGCQRQRARLLAAVGQSTAASSGYDHPTRRFGKRSRSLERSDPRLEARILGARSSKFALLSLREAAGTGFFSEENGRFRYASVAARDCSSRVLHQTLVPWSPNEAIKIADELERWDRAGS